MSGIPSICPHCGYDLQQDKAIRRWPLQMDPRGSVKWHGQTINLTPMERMVLWSLLKADGRALNKQILAQRVGYEGDNADSLMRVCVWRIRQKFADIAPIPICCSQGTIALDLGHLSKN